jgi:hypothetical protein
MTIPLLLLASIAIGWAISIAADHNMTRYWHELRRGAVLARRMRDLGL